MSSAKIERRENSPARHPITKAYKEASDGGNVDGSHECSTGYGLLDVSSDGRQRARPGGEHKSVVSPHPRRERELSERHVGDDGGQRQRTALLRIGDSSRRAADRG